MLESLLSMLILLTGPVVASGETATAPRTALPAPTTTHHYVANVGSHTAAVARVGFTVVDTGSSPAEIRALPKGTQALVYLGQDCPTRADRSFRRQVSRLAKSAKVFGYYLADEPVITGCPGGPAALATRTRYIRTASAGRQQSFIVVDDRSTAHAYRPGVTHLSMVGIDPYPCSVANPTCDFSTIRHDLNAALRAGVPLGRVVPVYQGFGQERTSSPYYTLPTRGQMATMLRRWAVLVPHPKMDYVYSWEHQGSANPTLRDSLSLKRLFAAYFAG